MAMKIESPHPFSERLLLFGGGGAGKTNSVLDIAANLADGDMYVLDADYSGSYERAIHLDHPELADRVHIHRCTDEWDDFIRTLEEVSAKADPEKDWLVVDPVSNAWEWAQNWTMEAIHGSDLTRMLIQLRKDNPDEKAYAKARSNLMNWELCKKEYAKVGRIIQRWHGHLVLVAEAKAVSDRDGDDIKQLYGPIGFYPSGQASLRHIASTNLFLANPGRNKWTMTTVKDRNREQVDREPVDSFAMDYLVGIAGWAPPKKAASGAAKKAAGARKAAPRGRKVTIEDMEGAEDEGDES